MIRKERERERERELSSLYYSKRNKTLLKVENKYPRIVCAVNDSIFREKRGSKSLSEKNVNIRNSCLSSFYSFFFARLRSRKRENCTKAEGMTPMDDAKHKHTPKSTKQGQGMHSRSSESDSSTASQPGFPCTAHR